MIVLATGFAGFLASYVMLRIGVESMALRYPLAVAVAYVAFLGLLWCWLRLRGTEEDAIDVMDASTPSSSSRSDDGGWSDAGGADFDAGSGDGLDLGDAGSLDEGLFVVVVLVVLFGVFVLVASLVWSAPILFAEILLDAALAAGLYRRLRRASSTHWLESAVSRTWKYFVGFAVILAIAGFAMQAYAPEAVSVGGVLAHG